MLHDTTQRPRIPLDYSKDIGANKCVTPTAIISTVSVYPAQSPQSIATYLKGAPDPGVGSLQVNPSKTLKDKAIKAYKERKLNMH